MAREIKYRIKQIGNKYYPQEKKFLFWHGISIPTCREGYYSNSFESTGIHELCYDSLAKAKLETTNYKNNYCPTFHCLKHTIETYLCTKDNKYYCVVDGDLRRLFSSSELACEFVSEFEEQKKKDLALEKERLKKANTVTIHKYVED